MTYKKRKLLEDIEELRQELNRLMIKKGEVNHQVITISNELDVLLNEYENMLNN